MPIPAPSRLRSPPGTPFTSSECLKATPLWLKPRSIWPPHRKATRCTWPTAEPPRTRTERWPSQFRCTFRNAPTALMKEFGYGKDYDYAHDHADAVTAMECLPDNLRARRFYQPTSRGLEKVIGERVAAWRAGRSRPGGSQKS